MYLRVSYDFQNRSFQVYDFKGMDNRLLKDVCSYKESNGLLDFMHER